MKMQSLLRFMIRATAVALLAGCGGSQPPIGAPRTVAETHAIMPDVDRANSWMKSSAKASTLL